VTSDLPQPPQNLSLPSFRNPHDGHVEANDKPHSPQNRRPSRFSALHRGHCMPEPPSELGRERSDRCGELSLVHRRGQGGSGSYLVSGVSPLRGSTASPRRGARPFLVLPRPRARLVRLSSSGLSRARCTPFMTCSSSGRSDSVWGSSPRTPLPHRGAARARLRRGAEPGGRATIRRGQDWPASRAGTRTGSDPGGRDRRCHRHGHRRGQGCDQNDSHRHGLWRPRLRVQPRATRWKHHRGLLFGGAGARASSDGGIVRPSALAVFRLMTKCCSPTAEKHCTRFVEYLQTCSRPRGNTGSADVPAAEPMLLSRPARGVAADGGTAAGCWSAWGSSARPRRSGRRWSDRACQAIQGADGRRAEWGGPGDGADQPPRIPPSGWACWKCPSRAWRSRHEAPSEGRAARGGWARAHGTRSSLARIRTCACGRRSGERPRPPLPRLRRRATQAPATGLLRQVPSRTQPAAASTAPSRPGSADTGSAPRCSRPDGQERTAVSGGLGTGVLIGGAPGAERIGEQAEAIPERLPPGATPRRPPWRRPRNRKRTAARRSLPSEQPRRNRTSGEKLLGLAMTPSSQGLEPPGIPARFNTARSGGSGKGRHRRDSDHNDMGPTDPVGLIHAVPRLPHRAESMPLSSLRNSFRSLGNLALRKGCGAWLTRRFDGDVAVA